MAWHLKLHNDLDAVGSRIVAEISELEIASTSYHTYENIDKAIVNYIKNKEFSNGDSLLICDICPTKETALLIEKEVKKGLNIILIDHHKTRLWVEKYEWAIIDLNKSATEILFSLYEGKTKGTYFDFVQTITAWDIWKLNSPYRERSEQMNTLLGFIGKDAFVKAFTEKLNADETEPFKTIIGYLVARKKRYVSQVIRTQLEKTRLYVDGFRNKFKIIFATDYISEIGHAVLAHPASEDIDYICVINPIINSCSLRSRAKGVDVGIIAKHFDGGGHPGAAGFPFDFTENIEAKVWKLLNNLEQLQNRQRT
jgi:oligoribonuclease NrnB/cAMP/cGMP phosphodiesterase (DHH superfamily)